jgi:two-component system, chemotaxis family, protein-glutamate methylesterase/glutaminase
MAPIRILVVDDSVVIRRLLSDTLSGDPALEVVGVASDGRIALAKIPLLKPDLITLDIEMPVMNGVHKLNDRLMHVLDIEKACQMAGTVEVVAAGR